MKKVLKPADPEESVHYSDFSGALLENSSLRVGPPVELTLKASYGSKYDGDSITLHLNDKDLEIVINFLKKLVTTDFKNHSNLVNPNNSILKRFTNQ